MKKQLLYLCLSVVLYPAFIQAQDTIYQKNGSVIIGKVIELSEDEVKYKRAGMEDGPLFVEKKKNLESIHYRNGSKDVFSTTSSTPAVSKVTATSKETIKPRYVLTLKDATKLKGTLKKDGTREIIFVDDNLGEQTINRNIVANLEREYGNEEWIVTLKDGMKISGKIIAKSENETVIQTKNLGIVKVNTEKIKTINPIDGTIDKTGRVYFKNPTCGLYFLAPTAIPLKKGEGYYHNFYGLGNEFCFAINNNASIGGGLIGPLGVFLTVKVSKSVNDFAHVGGGVYVGNSIFPIVRQSNFGIALGYCSFTVGDIDKNLTATVAHGFINNESSTDFMSLPLIQLSGTFRVSKKLSIVSENWFVAKQDPNIKGSSDYEPFISYGCRILSRRGSFDIGFLNTPTFWENDLLIGIPYIGFVKRFGKTDDDED